MNKIRTVIIDDEPAAREGVRMLLENDSEISVIAECANGREAITTINEKEPDLIFLDVQMPEINGFEVLEAIETERMPNVIFVTAYDKYAIRAFEINALDYLLKPFTVERFSAALSRVKTQINNNEDSNLDQKLAALLENLKPETKYLERLVVKNSGRISFINTEEIYWIEAADVYVNLHTARESHLIRGAISKLEAKLDPTRFLRVHRSAIVSVERIKELQPLFHGEYLITLRNGKNLTSSRNYSDKLQTLLGNSF